MTLSLWSYSYELVSLVFKAKKLEFRRTTFPITNAVLETESQGVAMATFPVCLLKLLDIRKLHNLPFALARNLSHEITGSLCS